MSSTKPSYKTQELPKHDLKKFLKRVSTPLGTKSTKAQGVISPHDPTQGLKRKDSKPKTKVKKSGAIVMSSKRPATQPASWGMLPKSHKTNMAKYGKSLVSSP